MVVVDDRTAVAFSLLPGKTGDGPEGCNLLKTFENSSWKGAIMVMNKAYEGDEFYQNHLDVDAIRMEVERKPEELQKLLDDSTVMLSLGAQIVDSFDNGHFTQWEPQELEIAGFI